ncbi:MAG: gamma-glutamylcyclotransferase [Acetobacteraceae bacterium]|nr:gamma-glutamylcyclotransferase [Acetobacteraceae bacterium]
MAPGFAAAGGHPALLYGWRRRFCIVSHRPRGTPDRPGLVLGLDRGRACRGWAWRVAAPDAAAVLACLDGRELVGGEYLRLPPVGAPRHAARQRRAQAGGGLCGRPVGAVLRPCPDAGGDRRTHRRRPRRLRRQLAYLHATARQPAALGVRDAAVQRAAAQLPPAGEA